MAHDFVLHGDYVHFNGLARCEACQAQNLKCALQQSDEGCMACAGANRQCIFSRSVVVSGPKYTFNWSTLLNGDRGHLKTRVPSVAVAATTPFGRGMLNKSRQSQKASPIDEPSSVPTEHKRNISEKVYARSASPPETEELRSRSGIDPTNRGQLGEILSLAEQAWKHELAQKNSHVEHWLEGASSMSTEGDNPQVPPSFKTQTALGPSQVTERAQDYSGISDPGVRIAENSDVDDKGPATRSESEDIRRPKSPSDILFPKSSGGGLRNQSPALEAYPWVEPLRFPSAENTISQPATSNEAMWRFARLAANIETASRFAIEGDSSSGLLDERELRFLTRNTQILSQLANDPRNLTPSTAQKPTANFDEGLLEKAPTGQILATSQRREEANNSPPRLQDYNQSQKALSPSHRPESAHTIATSHSVASLESSHRKPKSDTQASLLSGGKSSSVESYGLLQPSRRGMGPDHSSPTITEVAHDACKTAILDSNPRIPVYLLERLTQEQVRRYEKLGQLKSAHSRLRQQGKCPSGSHCLDEKEYSRRLESTMTIPTPVQITYPPDESTRRAVEAVQHHHTRPFENVDPNAELGEIHVGPSALPSGYPVPPNQSFPAEFECPFCFRLKNLQKPSDWVKHLHEDTQPFVCTFEHCWEPKAFKRKADWVRHENERHRQLEWWTCNKQDCSHKCFRKDNFIQHLVREHKMPEPKSRTQDKQSATTDTADDQVWKLVEACRHETSKNPKDEPCKFCGNVCNSWKKLSVHIGKHMENIAVPIWRKVALCDSTPESTTSTMSSALPLQPVPRPATYPLVHQYSSIDDRISTTSDVPQLRNTTFTPTPRALSVPSISPQTATSGKPYQCDVPGCTHDRGFATQTDLNRHQKGVHGIFQTNDSISFRCQGKDCNNADKIWPRRDNFRGHLSRIHPKEDIEELTERYTIDETHGLRQTLHLLTDLLIGPPSSDRSIQQPADNRQGTASRSVHIIMKAQQAQPCMYRAGTKRMGMTVRITLHCHLRCLEGLERHR